MPRATATKPNRRKSTAAKRTTPSNEGTGSVLDRIASLETLDFEGIKLGIYGHSGTGKTRAIGSFAELGPLLHMICSSNRDGEARSIRGTKGVDIVTVQEPDDLTELVDHASSSGKYSTIVLDHVTEFTNLTLSRIIGLEKLPEQGSWGMAQRDQYAQLGLQVKEYLRTLFDFPGNVIVVGQERVYGGTEDSDDDYDIKPTVSIATTPSIAGWIAPACDYFIRTYKRQQTIIKQSTVGKGTKAKKIEKKVLTNKVEYCLAVGPDPIYMTKFRVPKGLSLPNNLVVEEDQSVYGLLKKYLV